VSIPSTERLCQNSDYVPVVVRVSSCDFVDRLFSATKMRSTKSDERRCRANLPVTRLRRQGMNHPPTAVGGIPKTCRLVDSVIVSDMTADGLCMTPIQQLMSEWQALASLLVFLEQLRTRLNAYRWPPFDWSRIRVFSARQSPAVGRRSAFVAFRSVPAVP